MKILVCGSRDWTDVKAIEKALSAFPRDALLIHGDNGYDQGGKGLWGQPDELAVAGADKLAGAVGARLGMTVKRYTPNWKLGRSAGPIRNREQIKEQPDVVVVCHHDISKGKGTKDMVQVALAAGVREFVLVRSVEIINRLSAEEVARLLQ